MFVYGRKVEIEADFFTSGMEYMGKSGNCLPFPVNEQAGA